MLDHVSVQVADVEVATIFYTKVFASLGMVELMRFPRGSSFVVGLGGDDGFPHFWLSKSETVGNRELHLAFTADDRARVDSVHEAALAAGVEVLHAPTEWPEYHAGYYSVFLRDPDGNNVEAVCHRG